MDLNVVRFASMAGGGFWGAVPIVPGLSAPLNVERFQRPLTGEGRDLLVLLAPISHPLWRSYDPPSGPDLRPAFRSLRQLQSLPKYLDASERISFLIRFGLLLGKKGLGEEAGQVIGLAREWARQAGNERETTMALMRVGEAETELGRIEAARAVFREILQMIKRDSSEEIRLGILTPLVSRLAQAGDVAGAREIFSQALRLLEDPSMGGRADLLEQLVLEMIKAGELGRAQTGIEKIPPGYYKVRALCYWAAGWARAGNHETAREIFGEAEAAIREGKGLGDPMYRFYVLKTLGDQLLLAGPEYRLKAAEVIRKAVKALRKADPQNTSWLVQAGIDMAKAQQFTEASAFIKREIRDPGQRSVVLGNLAIELVKAHRFAEARDLLKNERLAVTDRFSGLHWLVAVLMQAGTEGKKMAEEVFEEIRTFVETHEFPGRIQGLIRVGRILAERGEVEAALRMFEEAQASVVTPADRIELALEWTGRLALPALSGSLPELFFTLRTAAQNGDWGETARRATMLGFRAGGIDYVLEHLSALPEEGREWVRAWAYYGGSLLPRTGEAKKELVNGLRRILERTEESKTRSVAIRALQNLSPSLLETVLMTTARDRLGLSFVMPHNVLLEAAEGRIEFPESDRILDHALFWLARHGNVQSQLFVAQLLVADNFPARRKAALQKILHPPKGPDPSSAPKKGLN